MKLLLALILFPTLLHAESLVFSQVTLGPLTLTTEGLTNVSYKFGSMGLSNGAVATATQDEEGTSHMANGVPASFWMTANGTGTLTASVPYTFRVQCAPSIPVDTHMGVVTFSMRLGVSNAATNYDSMTCNSGESFERSAVMTVTKEFNNPWWGPLVGVGAGAHAWAVVKVPEAPTFVLLIFGLAALTMWRLCGS
jgi:hypothetical protein